MKPKLSDKQKRKANELYNKYNQYGCTQKDLAEVAGVVQSTMSGVIKAAQAQEKYEELEAKYEQVQAENNQLRQQLLSCQSEMPANSYDSNMPSREINSPFIQIGSLLFGRNR